MTNTPLTRANTPPASRTMLPFYAAFNLILGATWTFQADTRTSIGLRAFQEYVPVDVVGGVTMGLGALIALGLLLQSRAVVAFILVAGIIVNALFTLAVIKALDPMLTFEPWPYITLKDTTSSLTASYWFVALAVCYFASARATFAGNDEDTICRVPR